MVTVMDGKITSDEINESCIKNESIKEAKICNLQGLSRWQYSQYGQIK